MKVLNRAVALLSAVASGTAGLEEAATAAGLPRSTAHRLLAALRHHGFVDVDGDHGFVVGPRVHQLGAVFDGGVLVRVAPDITELLCGTTCLSAQLYRRRGMCFECLAAANPFSGLRDVVTSGATFPLGDDASSHVLTAWDERPPQEGLEEGTLRRVRRQGWALTHSESVSVLSVPIRVPSGRVAAALSLSGPGRVREQAADLRAELRKAADLIEAELHSALEGNASGRKPTGEG
ncbi:IclR family transcriptional regulator [Streptomyces blastmyceticus]|uniref:IclR family transcriptional regulator NdgR n=1 Tax=Streptomyces blastmyceticus TaxID=68180 RepID=A0ABP3H4C9_9ACTN